MKNDWASKLVRSPTDNVILINKESLKSGILQRIKQATDGDGKVVLWLDVPVSHHHDLETRHLLRMESNKTFNAIFTPRFRIQH